MSANVKFLVRERAPESNQSEEECDLAEHRYCTRCSRQCEWQANGALVDLLLTKDINSAFALAFHVPQAPDSKPPP